MEIKLVEEISHDKESGGWYYKGIRYLLIRPETIIGIQKKVNEICGESKEALFSGGYTGGKLSAEKFAKELGLSKEEILAFMCSMGTQLGWGKMEWELREEKFVVRVHNSPFAEAYGNSTKGVCHLIEGVFAGVGEIIFGKAVSEERLCKAKGDDYCEIVVERR
ncbi:V4R domain-containing protein [Ferroglobus placidus]|uniref:V4R domain-containing protein n=1 Tax=Ferroglobus placidus TaxID=54261 RepID=UPI0001B758C4|nr:V4R domain-containing protein [Ferroglobus placidus]